MSVIETNTEAMKTDVGTITEYIEKLRSAANEIENVLSALTSSWEGDAAIAYEKRLKDDIDILRELIDTLVVLNGGTDNARKTYENCESNIADIIASINV